MDHGNPAPQVRANFQYQDDCAALVLLGHLGADDLDGVIVERATDLILVRLDGGLELVSIKHREANRSGAAAWSWSALAKDRVLMDLHSKWLMYDKQATVAFWSSAGFADHTYALWRTCAKGEKPSPDLVRQLARHLKISETDAREFLDVLHLPEEPLPRRKEIGDVAVRRTADLLRPMRTHPDRTAQECFDELRARLRDAATDTAARTTERAAHTATLAQAASIRDELRIRHEYVSRADIVDLLLRVHDRLSTQHTEVLDEAGWQSDPHFVGRNAELRTLAELLKPGDPHEVPPVVVHGMPGAGKTSLATQFAALNAGKLQAVFISGTSRVALQRALAKLQPRNAVSVAQTDLQDLGAPVTVRLPQNSATLLVIDGVTDPGALAGLIPRHGLCRVVITSTVRHLDQGFASIELPVWTTTESSTFIQAALPESSDDDRRSLGTALGHHPLAVTQAVNYCLASNRSISDFLTRLAAQPAVALQRGIAAGHSKGLVATIDLNVRLLREQHPTACDLLILLAHVSAEPFDVEHFGRLHGYLYVKTPYVWRPTISRWARLKAAVTRQPLPDAHIVIPQSARAPAIAAALSDDATREDAVDTLVRQSLVQRRSHGLLLHPLIATVIRQHEPDPVPWIEIGLGLYAESLGLADQDDVTVAVDPDIDHIAALTLLALDHGHSGYGVIGASIVVCQYLYSRGSIPALDTADRAAEFALRTLALTEHLNTQRLIPIIAPIRHHRVAAAVLLRAGRINEAIELLQTLFRLAEQLPQTRDEAGEVILMALLDLGAIAAHATRRDLALEILEGLTPYLVDLAEEPPDVQASIGHIRASLLRLLGRTEEAAEVNAAALQAASTTTASPRLLADLHTRASVLARDRGDSLTSLRHDLAVLDIRRAVPSKRIGWQTVTALIDSADGAIGALDFELAVRLLTEAEELARSTFGVDSLEYAKYLAVRGRLNVGRHHWQDAEIDLAAAASVVRQAGEAEQAGLAVILVHLGQAAMFLGDADAAYAAFDEAIQIDTALFGPEHPETLTDITIRNTTSDAVARQRQLYAPPRRTRHANHTSVEPSTSGTASPSGKPWPDIADFPGPRYEPMSGRIQIGVGPYGSASTWRLHEPGVGVRHGVITGPPGSGRTNALNRILINAMHSQRFLISPMAPTWSDTDRDTWKVASFQAEGPDAVRRLLQTLNQRLTENLSHGKQTDPTSTNKAILITIDDADQLFRTAPDIVPIVERITHHGSTAGFGLIVVSTDTTPDSFGGSSLLRETLLAGNHMSCV
ncbi:tetratricopeptide repeat protein [Hamadaea tsunoensis]|uniref:tetratricopeptide repeat protein n=1 Tax=Hamadaea tsunoensis TaxID=53368 RepID=UPI00146FAEBC|nr:tetratricopeptide repeat protein [Hamadaea tsunoensis]